MSHLNGKSSKKVLITGTTGFVGTHLARAFLKEGWHVFAALHKSPLPDSLLESGARSVDLNMDDPDSVRSILAEVDVICHLAAYLPPSYDDSQYAEECLKTNSLFTLRLAEQAERFPGVKFINFSSAQAYRSSNEPSDEEAPLYPADRATYYLVSKLAGEIYIEHLRRSGSLQAVTLRLGSCYGHGMASRSVVSIFMNKARSGETLQVYESNASLYDYVYIDDVTNVAVQAAVSGEPGVYNVGSGQSHSVLELAETVAATFPEHEVPIRLSGNKWNPPK
jgi:nucleoside-diphosphate-sugar epimerase